MAIMDMDVVRVGTADAKQQFSDLINQVSYGQRRVVITSRGRPKVAVVTLDDLRQIGVPEFMVEPKKRRQLEALRQADRVREAIAQSGRAEDHDPVEGLHRMRLERDQQISNNLR